MPSIQDLGVRFGQFAETQALSLYFPGKAAPLLYFAQKIKKKRGSSATSIDKIGLSYYTDSALRKSKYTTGGLAQKPAEIKIDVSLTLYLMRVMPP